MIGETLRIPVSFRLSLFRAGFYQCGPASVNAIRNGEVYLNYDTGFVFSEVNGDRVYWDQDSFGQLSISYIDKHSIGKKISTRKLGKTTERRDLRKDLTSHYKHPEGS